LIDILVLGGVILDVVLLVTLALGLVAGLLLLLAPVGCNRTLILTLTRTRFEWGGVHSHRLAVGWLVVLAALSLLTNLVRIRRLA